jgi:alcohol dehydrogenase
MRAAVFHKIVDITVDNVPDPSIEQDDDIIVRVTSTAICRSDLPIYKGFVPHHFFCNKN